jgi:TRAP-type transport system periplasmic protein
VKNWNLQKSVLSGFVVIASALSAQVSLAQTKWDLPTGYAVASFQTENVQQFANDIDKATAGKLKITLHPNGSLYKANEIKRAVQTGQTQTGEFILSGAANENALFGIDSIPFLADNYAAAKKLADASRPQLDKLLASQGMKLLFTSAWPGQSLYSVKAVNVVTDLKGTKMRAYNPATSRIAQLVGAQPATIQLAELGQALATGTVENFLTSSASAVENKLYESVKYLYTVNAWYPKNAIVVNKAAFDALDKATQEAVIKAGVAAEQRGWQLSEKKDTDSMKELGSKGMKITPPSDALRADLRQIGTTMTAEWLKNAGADGQAIVDAYRK